MAAEAEDVRHLLAHEIIDDHLTAVEHVVAGHGRRGYLARQHSYRLAVEEATDVFDDAVEIDAVVLLRDIAEMRREHDIVELAKRMIERQRLGVINVKARARDLLV